MDAAAVCFLTDALGSEENPNTVLMDGGYLESYDFDHDGIADRVELEAYQGLANYYYEVFYLAEGEEIIMAEDSVAFGIHVKVS